MARMRVLVVEDEELVRTILREVLDDEGFHVVEARTGDEAVSLIDGPGRLHAVVTDIHMPGARDGLAVGRHARRRYPGIPVVYCTGRPDLLPDAPSDADVFGQPEALVRKPYVPSEIVAFLRGWLPAVS